jgi:ABC-type bacteriocin/lantibiotic exporter with double-glycine peptidase domain
MNTTHVKMPKDDLRWLLNRVGRYWPWQLASVALLSLSSLASFADPLAIKWLIDSAIPRRNLFGLVVAAGLIFVAYSLRGILDSWGAIVNFNAGCPGNLIDRRNGNFEQSRRIRGGWARESI